jgi:putative YhdH/YhfP family quinone oxidoreductase
MSDVKFRAYVVNKTETEFSAGLADLKVDDLSAGEVLIKVAYSGINYKDGLASIPDGKVIRKYPLVPGIDLSGSVVESSDPRFKAGDQVLATSYDLGVAHTGGFSEYARLKADWLIPLPTGLTLKEAMVIGTPGYTSALALHQMELMGLKPGNKPVLVTGATGGVGSMSISILKAAGYTVAASTGKSDQHAYLESLGASEIIERQETSAESKRPLEKERWASCIDNVGGSTLAYLLRTTCYGGSVAVIGNTGGTSLNSTVFPFILRGVNLLGIESANTPMELRRQLWQQLATNFKPAHLEEIIQNEVSLDELPQALATILKGGVRGRVIVRLQ